MKVIFFKDVPRVGKRFDVKDVSDGYATNFLLPNGFASKATSAEVARLEKMKTEDSKMKQEQEATLVKNLKKIAEITLEIEEEANEKGHLFKGIGKDAIVAALKASSGVSLEQAHIELEKPIKEVGDHKIAVKVAGHNGFFTLKVKAA